MEISCLGKVDIADPLDAGTVTRLFELLRSGMNQNEATEELTGIDYLKLGENYYVPVKGENGVDTSKKRCETVLKKSRKEPQQITKVKNFKDASSDLSIDYTMINCIWLYDGRIYQLYRNDYDYKQIHLLILDYIDKEKNKFEKLNREFKIIE